MSFRKKSKRRRFFSQRIDWNSMVEKNYSACSTVFHTCEEKLRAFTLMLVLCICCSALRWGGCQRIVLSTAVYGLPNGVRKHTGRYLGVIDTLIYQYMNHMDREPVTYFVSTQRMRIDIPRFKILESLLLYLVFLSL